MDIVTLGSGGAGLQLIPALGGAVARYWLERGAQTWEWLRPTSAPALAGGDDPYETAAFPLVPYSNRIRDGRFRFRGIDVAQPLNRPPERHSIHGHGWQANWAPVEVGASEARLEYRHAAGAWPWAYRAIQRFTLTSASLTVELALSNESDAAMPAGLGWHPYFPRTARTTLTAVVDAMWQTDDQMLPSALAPPPAGADLTRGLAADAVALDNVFVGWRRRAAIDWPERSARVIMTADAPLDCLVVYTPPARPFLCAEPVSHVTDAFNLAESGRTDTGMRILEPGETLSVAVTLRPEITT
jgi:aldose 1-epimerase